MPQTFTSHIPDSGAPIPAFFEVPSGDIELVAAYSTNDYSAVYNYPLYFTLRDVFLPGLKDWSIKRSGPWDLASRGLGVVPLDLLGVG